MSPTHTFLGDFQAPLAALAESVNQVTETVLSLIELVNAQGLPILGLGIAIALTKWFTGRAKNSSKK